MNKLIQKHALTPHSLPEGEGAYQRLSMTQRRRLHGLLRSIGLLMMCMSITGCQQLGWLVGGVVPEYIQPVYLIQPRVTLILADDPQNALGDPALTSVLAQEVEKQLLTAKAVPRVIEQEEVARLQRLHGQSFAQLPADQVGRELGAEQVIHVSVAGSTLGEEPGLIRPAATALVKVIDVAQRRRLFPPAEPSDAMMQRAGETAGYPVNVRLRYRTMGREAHSMLPMIRQALAIDLGNKAGQLFFKRKKEAQTGEWSDADSGAP